MISKIKGKLNNTGRVTDEKFMESVMILAYEFKRTVSEVLNMPIPHYIAQVNFLNKQNEKRNKK